MRFLWARCARLVALGGLILGLAGLAGPAPAQNKNEGTTLQVREGQPAPDVELPATQIGTVLPGQKDAKSLRLRDLQGKKNVVLYFFPKAMTKG
jgi:hypothetical protein